MPGSDQVSAAGGAKQVLLALSGGVDSAVAARLLQRQGYGVHGLVIRFSPAHDAAVEAARQAARELSIPLEVAEAGPLFEREVIEPFCQSYAGGATPNPCVLCNPAVKFKVLADRADALGIGFIASGHYAAVRRVGGVTYAAAAKSAARDQSYMLYRLSQGLLSRLLLPVGEYEKPAIREMARELGLSSAEAPDSQEICFIPSGDHAGYIEARGHTGRAGRFIGPEGQDLGPHRGLAHYTVGQRKRLGLSLGRPAYVQDLLPDGDIQLCYEDGIRATGAVLEDLFTATGAPLDENKSYTVKIRSVAKPCPCTLHPLAGGGPAEALLQIDFETPQFAPAPGQHAVLYDGPLVVGGGRIRWADFPRPSL